MSRGPDAATLLERRLLLVAQAGGQDLIVGDVQSVPWASATFNGARHRLTVQATASPGLDAWLQSLSEAELPLRGHLVADLALLSAAAEGDRLRVEIEVLTVEDR